MAIVARAIPETWKKITFYYNNVLGDTATTLGTSNADGTANIYDRDESTIWQVDAAQTTAEIISSDLVNSITADYLAIGWHNFNTLGGVNVTFGHSSDGITYTEVVDSIHLVNDHATIKEFTSQSKDFWRLKLDFTSGDRPQAAYIIWGEKTELDFSSVGFEPNQLRIRDLQSVNEKGYLNKITSRFTERKCKINISEADSDVYDNAIDWHETIKQNNFFVGWENQAHESDAFIMRAASGRFVAPFIRNGYRNLNFNLIGHT